MTDDPFPYHPDTTRQKRLDEHAEKPKPPVTVDKPIRFRVGTTRRGTMRHHYRRKARTTHEPDLRNPTYY